MRDPPTTELDDLRLARLRTRPQRHKRLRPLPPPLVRHRHNRTLEHRRMSDHRLLHLDRRDVLATRDDHVLRPVPQLHVPVGVNDREVARVQPPARERLRRGLRIAVVALHHGVPPHHDLAHLRPVGGDGRRRSSTTLAPPTAMCPTPCRARRRARSRVAEPSHSRLPRPDGARPVGLGQSVRRGSGGGRARPSGRAASARAARPPVTTVTGLREPVSAGVVERARRDRRRAVEVRHTFLLDQPPDQRRHRPCAGTRGSRRSPSPPRGSTSRCSGTSAASTGRRSRSAARLPRPARAR